MSMLRTPSAARNTIRARCAACWLLVRARIRRCNSSRSSTVTTISVARRLISSLLAQPDQGLQEAYDATPLTVETQQDGRLASGERLLVDTTTLVSYLDGGEAITPLAA